MPEDIRDRRIERTRQALLGAFVQLMFDGRRYDRIRVQDLIERAGVGRSTFYEHYRSKDDVLAESIRHPFTPLANAVSVDADIGPLRAILLHFRENRVQARVIFGGSVRRRVSRILASMIEERLRARARSNGVVAPAELAVAAVAIAEGQLATIVAWSAGETTQDEAQLAQTLLRIAQATAAAICGETR
jgi:AcrR family transcriptional regulator